jgi:hypothetical protein
MRLAAAALLLAACLAACLAPGAAFAQAAGPAPSASGAPFTFTVTQSRVIVKVSDTSLRPDPAEPNRPGYFKVMRSQPQQLIVSGWLEPGARYKGIKAFWESESKSPAYAGPLAPTRLEMSQNGAWEVVAYDVALPGGITSAHLRAERVQAGTWIDLHLSTTSTRPPATLRAELIAALGRVEIAEKK